MAQLVEIFDGFLKHGHNNGVHIVQEIGFINTPRGTEEIVCETLVFTPRDHGNYPWATGSIQDMESLFASLGHEHVYERGSEIYVPLSNGLVVPDDLYEAIKDSIVWVRSQSEDFGGLQIGKYPAVNRILSSYGK